MPVYWLYSLVFIERGISESQVSILLAVWSITGVVAEVPTGALADRWSRRSSIVLGGAMEAAGFLTWILWPELPGFAAGFVLWGVGGVCASGAIEALLHDGLDAAGAVNSYASVMGRVRAAELAAQPLAAAIATGLFAVGSHRLVLWSSVGWALGAAALATTLPEHHGQHEASTDEVAEPGYLATLRAGLVEAATAPGVRSAVIVLALVGGIDAIDEYFPLLAQDWGVSTLMTPLSLAVISLVGAAGAALAGRASRWPSWALGAALGAAGGVLLLGRMHLPIGLIAVACFYGAFRMVTVVLETRLQARITGSSRATVGSVAALGTELSALALFAGWAAGGLVAVAVLVVVAAAVVAVTATRR